MAGAAAGAALMVGGVWVAHATREGPPSGTPETGWVRSVPGPVRVLSPGGGKSGLYVGTGRGLYRQGETQGWERVFAPGFWAKPVEAVGMDYPAGNRLWASAGSQLYFSADGGRSWRPGLRCPAPILCLGVLPGASSSLLVGTAEGLYQSEDGGLSGHRAAGTPGQVSFLSLLFDPEHPERCFALSGRGLFRSEDGGKSWTRQDRFPLSRQGSLAGGVEEEAEIQEGFSPEEDLPPTGGEGMPPQMAADLSRQLLWVSTERGIFQSRDGGHEWDLLPSTGFARGSGPAERLLVHPAWPGSLFALKDSQVYVYRKDRQEWLRAGDLPGNQVTDAQWADEGSSLWVGTEAGLFRVLLKVPEGPKPLEGTASSAEPSIQQVHRMTIAYAELSPGKIRRWRDLARLRAFVPSFSVGLDQDRDANIVSSTTAGVTKFSVGPDRHTRSLDFGFSWDLGDLVWSQNRSLPEIS